MSTPIRCESLSKRFRRVVAVDGLNLQVPEGSMYALVGPNGAGKTTLIKCLLNLIRPSSGRVWVLDTESRRIAGRDLARIGYVSEDQEMPGWMTLEYLLGYLKPFYPGWDDELAGRLVADMELPKGRPLRQFSRGMKMKAALVCSLAYRPRLIVLDEPFGGLDPLVRDEFIQGLLELANEATVFVSSHDLAEVESFASHVGFLDAGQMQLSEEIGTLTGRFREIEITFGGAPVLPPNWPQSWLRPQTSSAVLRFVESRFDEGRTAFEVARVFPDAAAVSMTPMSLREIFLAVARARRVAIA
jgi:ABC-2 type transport system ATP-binding protein